MSTLENQSNRRVERNIEPSDSGLKDAKLNLRSMIQKRPRNKHLLEHSISAEFTPKWKTSEKRLQQNPFHTLQLAITRDTLKWNSSELKLMKYRDTVKYAFHSILMENSYTLNGKLSIRTWVNNSETALFEMI